MPDPRGLADRGVVVTGAAGGIGRAIAVALADAGARVMAVDLSDEAVREVAAELAGGAARHAAAGADLRDLAGHAPLFERAERELGRFDALVHAAAVLRRRATIDDVTEEDWDLQVDTNLKATFFLDRAAAAVLIRRGEGGRIVNFTSQGWWTGGFGGSVVYAATKGGVVSLSRGLARALAPHRITVNTVAPGAADTPMMRSGLSEAELEAFVGTIPLGRMAEPEEIAGAVAFLVSDQAGYITGATLNVTGGQIMY